MSSNAGCWVLVCASEPLQSMLADLVRERGYEPRLFATPLQAVEWLEEDGDTIEHVLVAQDHEWSEGLQELIDDEYPGIHLAMVA